MPEASESRMCPYLRGRRQPQVQPVPSIENHCLVTASIHLPRTQQSRYCLGGHHETCARFQRQNNQPLPGYVTGVTPAAVTTSPPPPPLTPLIWRRPWFRALMRLFFIVLIAGLVVWGWRWQQQQVQPRWIPRPPLPTSLSVPTPVIDTLFQPPSYSVPGP